MIAVFYILLAILLVIVFAGGYTFFAACRRRKDLPWYDPQALKHTAYGKHIDLIAYSAKWMQEHHPQDIYVTSKDGLKLHGYWIPAENPRGTILLAHGYRSTMLVDFGMVLDMYYKEGMNLLLPEQRCHGKSEGKYITFGVKEAEDMRCWIAYHNQQLSPCSVVVSGLSMGASTVMYMLDGSLPSNVKAAICDCGFTSPAEIIGKIFRETVHLPAGIFIWVADLFARVFAGFSFYEKDSRKTLAKNTLPILLAHGTADDFVPCKMSVEAFDACKSEKYLILAANAEHGYSYMKAKEEYYNRIVQILNDNL